MTTDLQKEPFIKNKFIVRVSHKRLDYFTVYNDVMAVDYNEAGIIARQRFKEFGGNDIRDFEAFVFDKYKYSK